MAILRGLIPKFLVREIPDRYLQENFARLNDYFLDNTQMAGFKHFEFDVPANADHLKIPHNLGFAPKDLISLSVIGAGGVQWHYDEFDDQFISVTAFSGGATVRIYLGTHIEGTV